VINDALYVTPRGQYVYFEIEGKEDKLFKVNASAVDRIETNQGSVVSTQRQSQGQSRGQSQGQSQSQQVTNLNPIARIPRDKAKADIKEALAQRHPDRYSIQKTLLDDNMRSYDQLAQLPSNSVSDRVLIDLKSRHYPNFSIIKTLYIQNMKAHEELNK